MKISLSFFGRILKKLGFLIFVLIVFSSCTHDNFEDLSLIEKLNSLDGVSATEIMTDESYTKYKITIQQLVDHANPGGQTFSQHMYLWHKSEESAMVFAPSGYAVSENSFQELTNILDANLLTVCHRYFAESRPNPENWEFLTIEQAATDHHKIVQEFKKIYKAKWVSSGASKSGMTCLYHKRFFPEDVDATVAYVAPFLFDIKDMRFFTYIENLGDQTCYENIKNFQKTILEKRQEVGISLSEYVSNSTNSYDLDLGLILELAVMDYPFALWQYQYNPCEMIPSLSSDAATLFSHLNQVVPISGFSVEQNSFYLPFIYQSLHELGAVGYKTDHIDQLLTHANPYAEGNTNYSALLPVNFSAPGYSSSTIDDVYSWLQAYGNNIIYIYGLNDPWTAGAFEPTAQTNALRINQTGENHRVKIVNLDQQDLVLSTLENWLGIPVYAP